ncbi:unnamed protein product [Trichobilharzia regenti]|nr:unnamed protein product [Trichobilharzia regenti]
MHLWNNTLTLYTQSSRPDISPVGSDVLRYLVYESFSFPVISTCGYFIDIEKKNKDTSLYQLNSSQSTDDKAISAIFYLLDVLEEQIEACERRPNLSIMAVVSSRPFYAMLNAIRSVLGVMPSSSESQKSKDEVKSTLCDEEYLMMKTCLQRSTLFRKVNGKCILQRIIFLGIRISEIVLPIVGHESPEGILLQPDCMNDNNNVNEVN